MTKRVSLTSFFRMEVDLEKYCDEMQQELTSILDYWMFYTIDSAHGGFVGRIAHDNKIDRDAPKGSVLHSRILWTFSAAYNLTGNKKYQEMAERAFEYIADKFIDKGFGGVYWTVDRNGCPLDTKKQIYALSFAIYGLSEFYQSSKEESAKEYAINLYHDIQNHSYDQKKGGYIEGLSRNWKELKDRRLSAKDANEKKSMNTHLHVLEGFANLYRAWPDKLLKERLIELVDIFLGRIISEETGHLLLFFDDDWNSRSGTISYGHDIEAAWLVQEAAGLVKDELSLLKVKDKSILLADAARKGVDKDGGLWYEYDAEKKHLIKQKHSWPQAEAMIGFFNAWQNTGDEKYLKQSWRSWEFVKNYMHDKHFGEWYWGVYEDYSPMSNEDKVGIWKCPYHNSRACIEIIHRIKQIQNTDS